ncbi:MAG: DNA-directed DNA polymerase [Nanoarchaeota archaeon]|nr:DNA-directed DNA polymerase [Nanoarchaeota archaeon]MBU1004554.1 DNA-directed DNA polymerase [Nanoarchaeota archaeon]MBU1945793.1 DNA-directed DNA polymerase [Nanoarchaeota archaeon]
MADKILFYPIDVTYKIENEKAVIYLFGRTAEHKQVCVIDEDFKPYFYVVPKKGNEVEEKLLKIKVEKDNVISEVVKTEKVKRHFLGKDIEAIKVFVKLPRDVPVIRDVVKDWEILDNVTEYDIRFKKRYLIDKGITPLQAVEAKGDFITKQLRVPVLKADKIEPKGEDVLENPKILAFDIETYNPNGKSMDMENNPILMVSFYGQKFKKVITWKHFKTDLDYIEFVKSEAELIERFKEIVNEQKPDIITGYFSDEFDLPYIQARANKYKIKIDIGLDFSELNVKKSRRITSDIIGINHLDIFKFIKRIMGSSIDVSSLSLNSVAAELIGEKKVEVDLENLAHVWDKKPEELEIYCEYNLKDSLLTYKLAEKMLPNIIEMVKIVGMPIPEIGRVGFSQLVESYILKQAPRFNELAPELPHHRELMKRNTQTYQGAFVYEPKPGLYKDIMVFDYRSLYPSIISSHNLDPGTLGCNCCEGKKKVPVEGKDYWFCSKKKGFLPALIEDLITRRVRIKEIMKEKSSPLMEARSLSLKLLANSFYGYLGFPMARWYSFESARSTAAYGRFYIHKVIDEAQKAGFNVLYSDTDSVFLSLDGKTKKDANHFQEKINMELPGIMELEYEGFYPAGIFVSAKMGKFGAKKKYALLSKEGNLKIRGFETVRRNWSPIAKKVQENVLNIVLKENKPKKAMDYTLKVIDELRNNKIPLKDVIIYTQLQKEIDDYDAIGPHVAIAERMRQKGMPVGPGSRIEYVITKHGTKIRDKAKLPSEVSQDDYDPDYYINNQVIPAVEKIFEVLGYKKEDISEHKDQDKLSKFF